MSEEWSEWIEHDHKGCPLPVGTLVHVIGACGDEAKGRITQKSFKPLISQWLGKDTRGFGYVVRYRYKRPRALRDLIDLVESLPETEDA